MQIENQPIDRLIPYARNSRTHSEEQIAQVAASIKEFGFTNPVLIDSDGGIIAGHGRVMAARKLGLADVPCIRLSHLTESQRRAYVIADNKLALNSGWDEKMLSAELASLKEMDFDLNLLGFGVDLIDVMNPDLLVAEDKDPDDVPEKQKDVKSKRGDMWICGAHRVMCGDSTSSADWGGLMRNELADLCWTDPPYNVAYESKLAGSIKNDSMADEEFGRFLTAAFRALFERMHPGAAIYVAHADTEGYNFRRGFREAGFKLSGCLVWKKDSLVLGRSDYQWIHEPILYGWKPGAAHRWFGGRKQTTVSDWSDGPITKIGDNKYQIVVGDSILTVTGDAKIEETMSSILFHEKPKRSEDHPTMKPVGLIEKQIKCNGRTGDTIIDAFGGSGSTLMAAERMGLKSRLMELDEKFVDVIVRRWQQYTGKRATHAVTGKEFGE